MTTQIILTADDLRAEIGNEISTFGTLVEVDEVQEMAIFEDEGGEQKSRPFDTVEYKLNNGGEIEADDVTFNAKAIAAAWEAADAVPVCVAVAITNEFTENEVIAADGHESDGDVYFTNARVLFEEKAVGVCARDVAEKYAPGFVELGRDDGKVLAVNPGQIFTEQSF